MTMLHTVNKSPFQSRSLESCLSRMGDGSALLLIEDGVYSAVQGTQAAALVASALKRVSVYVLGPDLEARGMPEDKVLDGITVVGYEGFVDLAAQHDNVQSWL